MERRRRFDFRFDQFRFWSIYARLKSVSADQQPQTEVDCRRQEAVNGSALPAAAARGDCARAAAAAVLERMTKSVKLTAISDRR